MNLIAPDKAYDVLSLGLRNLDVLPDSGEARTLVAVLRVSASEQLAISTHFRIKNGRFSKTWTSVFSIKWLL